MQSAASTDNAIRAAPRVFNAAADLLDGNLSAGRGSKLAYIDDSGRYTYDELSKRVNRCANALIALGIRREQRILVALHDSIDFPTVFLGAIKAGIVPVAVNTLLTTSDFDYMLRDSRATALIVSEPLLSAFAPLFERLPDLDQVIVSGINAGLHQRLDKLLSAAPDQFETVATCSDEACFWGYSSGSTGAPKGTVHVHTNLKAIADLYGKPILGIAESDVVFSAAKLFFAYGLGNALVFPLSVGATTVLMAERPTPAAVFKRLREHRPTIFCGVRRCMRRCSRRPICRQAMSSTFDAVHRPVSRCPRISGSDGRSTSASRFSMASARPRCCISSCRTGRGMSAMARQASRCPVTS